MIIVTLTDGFALEFLRIVSVLTGVAVVGLIISRNMAGILFEDIFDVKDIDPDGKKFDRGQAQYFQPIHTHLFHVYVIVS